MQYWYQQGACKCFQKVVDNLQFHRVVSRAGLSGSGSGLKLAKILGFIRAWHVLFVLGAQKYN